VKADVNKFDVSGSDAAYAQAFRDYGLDVEAAGPGAGEWLRARSIAVQLAAALDDWAMARRLKKGEADGTWKVLLAVARAADPDPLRTQVRQALESGDKARLNEAAKAAAGAGLSATTLVVLAKALRPTDRRSEGLTHDDGLAARAVGLLREGQRRYPGDFWVNHQLARLLEMGKPPQLEEAIRFYTAALALRPQSPGVYLNLGNALNAKGRLDEAEAAARKAIELKPDYAAAHHNLGIALYDQGRLDEAPPSAASPRPWTSGSTRSSLGPRSATAPPVSPPGPPPGRGMPAPCPTRSAPGCASRPTTGCGPTWRRIAACWTRSRTRPVPWCAKGCSTGCATPTSTACAARTP
jgi:tetratricopeptide (TPR) repeat protein